MKVDVKETQTTVVIRLSAEEADILAKLLGVAMIAAFEDLAVQGLVSGLWEFIPELENSEYNYYFDDVQLTKGDK
jgi:hypothetical protein